MRVRLLPAVHGHIADSVRDGPAVRRTACPPGCAGLPEDCWRVCKPPGRSLMASSWPTHRQDPSAAQRVAADPGSGGGLPKGCCRSAVRLSVRAWRRAPRCSAPRPARGASGCSRAGSLSAWTLDGPAVDSAVDLACTWRSGTELAEVKYWCHLRIPPASAMPAACSAHPYPGVTRQRRRNE